MATDMEIKRMVRRFGEVVSILAAIESSNQEETDGRSSGKLRSHNRGSKADGKKARKPQRRNKKE